MLKTDTIKSVALSNENISNKIKTRLGLKLHARLSSKLIKRCMILSGFNKSESDECSQLYLYFMGMTLEYEIERLKILCRYSDCNLMKVSDKLKALSKTQFMTNECNDTLEMIKKAMMRYRYESYFLLVKCMLTQQI